MLSVIIVIIFAVFCVAFQKLTRQQWSSPSSIYIYWSCFLIIGGFFSYPEYNWKGPGLLWWLLSCFLFSLGTASTRNVKSTSRVTTYPHFLPSISCKILLWAYFVVGLFYSILMLRNNGFSIFSISSLSNLYDINTYMMQNRYGHEDLHESVIQQLCLSFTYGLPICTGYYLSKKSFKECKYICSFCLVPNLLITSLNNTKSGTIFAVMLFVTGYLIGYIDTNSHQPKITRKTIRLVSLLGIAFLAVMILAIFLRHNNDTARTASGLIVQIFIDYLFGGTLNFDYYFDTVYNTKLVHDYLEGSNIITANFYWIEHYTYIGALAVWFIRGCVCGILYQRLRKKNLGVFGKVILAYMYINAMYFFIWVPFIYTTVTIGVFILFPFFLMKLQHSKV